MNAKQNSEVIGMVERVAFRLFVRRGYTHAFGTAEASWERSVGTIIYNECMGDARSVIEELRVPTDAMVDAMADAGYSVGGELAIWDAGIDAALNEQVSG